MTIFGTTVSFDADLINRILGIRNFPEVDFYFRLKEGATDITNYEVQHTLSLGRGLRIIRGENTCAIGKFCEEAKIWRKFLTGRVLGATKDGESTMEQQHMLFCIFLGKRFNVGRWIYDKIHTMREPLRKDHFGNMSLSFPSLITELCSTVPRQDGFYEVNTLGSLDQFMVANSDRNVASTQDFHQVGKKGKPGLVNAGNGWSDTTTATTRRL